MKKCFSKTQSGISTRSDLKSNVSNLTSFQIKAAAKITGLILILFSSIAFGQSPKYQEAMQKGLSAFEAAKTPDEYLASADSFDAIAQTEVRNWLPFYYSAYSNLKAGLLSADNLLKDVYFNKALQQIHKADPLSANNSEIFSLKAYIQFMMMTVDPQSRRLFYEDYLDSLEKAKALDPNNPRPYLIEGQSTFYTPEAFGGGKKMARPFLATAVEKFAKFKPETDLSPIWGAAQAQKLLGQCE